MSTTITIRADASLRALLEQRAAATGRSLSEVVREILVGALAERRLADRIRPLRGSLVRRRRDDTWSRSIKARSWRP